nr:hypothetical protein BaRGS_023165 [Batillaria attramentaria]
MGQQAQEELRTVKTLNVELMATRQQLQEKLAQLEKLREEDKREMAELRSQHHQTLAAMSGSGSESSDVLTDLYDASLEKYEVLKKDYDVLREKYAELAASHSSACCQLEAMADLQKQLAEMRLKRDVAMQDRVAFQQQCTAAFQNLDQTLSENRKIKAALDHLQHEHENCLKDKQQVMSERDTVHKEIEQLQDKLSEKTKLTEKLSKEKAAAEQEIERLQQELTTTASARDKYRQESQGAMETRAQLEAERRDLQREYQLMEQQRDIARKERHQALEQMDILIKETYEKTQKEKAEEMDQVAKETEVLKKQIDKIKHELTDAEQEAMVATKRRDWAFSEIDKTVQERESIRTLCDNLRRDRDRAVSELAKALRNSDECEKQKNDAVKELKELRDKYEVLVERDARRQQLNSVGHNHSRDSAIDADLQEWETETLEIELDGVDGHDLGFELVGGKEDPQFPSDTSLFISHVNKGGAAEGKLSPRHHETRTITFEKSSEPVGFQIQPAGGGGIFVSAVNENSLASQAGLVIGDQLLEYNSIVFESITKEQAIIELNKPCSTMRLTLHNNLPKYNKVQNIPGDRFFIRTNFTRAAEGEGELDFRKDDILVVESTVHGTLGVWLAWLVDERGNRIRAGSIPSRLRLEDEIVLRRSHSESWSLGDSEELKGSRRGSGEIRDAQFLQEKLSNKAAKDSFDHYSKVEQEYGHLFSAVVQGGNLAEMCMHIKTVINSEQKKAIWVTVSSL